MSWRPAVSARVPATLLLCAFTMFLLSGYAAGQAASAFQPKDELYGGYAWLDPNGVYDFGIKARDITSGFDASNTYYLRKAPNWGLLFDNSYHFYGRFAYDELDLCCEDMYYLLGGVQYKHHSEHFGPFARAMLGAVLIKAPTYVDEWRFAGGAGVGVDLTIWRGKPGPHDPELAIRLVQADYIYSSYHPLYPTGLSQAWNSVRLSGGLVLGLGSYYAPPPTAACSVQPTEVMDGEPVTVTATGSGFHPKHALTYAWTSTGGKLDTANAQSARIDTTGLAAGSYTASATISDPKVKNNGTATCNAAFVVKPKPQPPQVSCSASPSTVKSGDVSTITTSASSPDNAQITGYTYSSSAGKISGTGTSATLDTTGLPPGSVTVTVTATDARNLSSTGTCTVGIEQPPAPPQCSKINQIQFPNKKLPWRVDNVAKQILDEVAGRLKSDPNGRIVIVGYADGEKAPMEGTGKNRHEMDLAAQRAVNAKAYLVQQQGIDPGRIEVRKGTGKSEEADIIWLPQGADENACADLQGTTPVDETKVTPSENAYPKPRPAAPEHAPHKKAAAAPSNPQ